MIIRPAVPNDKNHVLNFCQNTFSWGDYISDVWNYWLSEGNFLVADIQEIPVGICHAAIIKDEQVWIEGIRIDENFRRKGFAKSLVQASEEIGRKNNCKSSLMLIAESNSDSLKMASSLGYEKENLWFYYSLLPKKHSKESNVSFVFRNTRIINTILSKFPYFIKSWRWSPSTKNEIFNLIQHKNIILCQKNQEIESGAIMTTSEHFEKTALVTITFGNQLGLKEIFSFLQNYFYVKNFKRIQILTYLDSFPKFEGLENKISFYLMKKNL